MGMRYWLFIIVLGVALGIEWGLVLAPGVWAVIVLTFAACCGLAYFYRTDKGLGLQAALLALAIALGLVRAVFAITAFIPEPNLHDGAAIEARGVVVREPDTRESHVLLTVDIEQVNGSRADMRFLVRVPTYPAFTYGDSVSLKGTVEVPTSFETETGRVFDYRGFLAKDGVQYLIREPEISRVGTAAGNPIVTGLLAIKQAWIRGVSLVVPEPASALVAGLVVGAKRSLGENWLERFRTTGVVHIVVLSGFNLSIVAVAIMRLLQRAPRGVGFILGALAMIAFAVLAGASATVVRATVMALIALVATAFNRPYLALRGLCIAALGMVLVNPFTLVYDPGFQLSCVATLGLITMSPLFERYVQWIPVRGGVREIVTATVATQLAVLPLLLYQVGQASVVALPANLLILPFVPFAMLVGLLAGLVAMVYPVLALPFAYATNLVLSWMFTVVSFLADVPFASIGLPPLPWYLVLLTYIVSGAALYQYHLRRERSPEVVVVDSK